MLFLFPIRMGFLLWLRSCLHWTPLQLFFLAQPYLVCRLPVQLLERWLVWSPVVRWPIPLFLQTLGLHIEFFPNYGILSSGVALELEPHGGEAKPRQLRMKEVMKAKISRVVSGFLLLYRRGLWVL